jgi:hypothetical protein
VSGKPGAIVGWVCGRKQRIAHPSSVTGVTQECLWLQVRLTNRFE